MRLKVEATIDIDEKRKIWIEGDAQLGDDELEHIGEVVGALTEHVTTKALDAHEAVKVKEVFKSESGKEPQDTSTFDT